MTARRTLIDAVVPGTVGVVRDGVLVLLFSVLLALCARISIPLPFTPVPITGQTLGVLLTGALLGSRRGALALLCYLGEGLAGLPVFAGGTSAWSLGALGLPVIIGPTCMYTLYFPVAAAVTGWLAERGWDHSAGRTVLALLAGEVAMYAVAVSWLTHFTGFAGALTLGVLPFLPGDLVKMALVTVALPSGWRLLRRAREVGVSADA
ncbi:MAG: biotin transporter BioY [Chloroflexi bacterium]|nr:biotin transporter BioY [Chloroflexota bacterium]